MTKFTIAAIAALVFVLTATTDAEARRHRHHRHHHRHIEDATPTRIVEHPAGCPRRAFCGCGVGRRVGLPDRSLWLALNWLRFPRASASAGMVAVRRHHVFYIERMLTDRIALAYDPNSGRHLTRIHPRSIAGYTIVNPRPALAGTKIKIDPADELQASFTLKIGNRLDASGLSRETAFVAERKRSRTVATTFNDRHTACAPYHLQPGRLEVAHPSLPCGTQLEITNRRNGRKVVAYVADKGPCTTAHCRSRRPDIVRTRQLDLSPATARALRSNGKIAVEYAVLR